MTLWVEIRCSGPSPAGGSCPEGHGERGFGSAIEESHPALKAAYSRLLKQAEGDGWQRDTKMLALRCPHCAAAFMAADPVEIAGIPFQKFIEGVELCVAGRPPSSWAGRDGFPTATQFRNAVNRFPSLRQRYEQAPDFKGGRGVKRAAPVAEERWAMVLDRLRAGERVADVCTGLDGWPTLKQWHHRRATDEGLSHARGEIRATVRRPSRPRLTPEERGERQRMSAERKRAADAKRHQLAREVNEFLRAERERAKALARAEREERRREAEAAEKARRNEERWLAREARLREKEQKRWKQAEEQRAARFAEEILGLAPAATRRVRNRNLMVNRRKVVRLRVDPPEAQFDRRLGKPDAEGCRYFIGPVPTSISVGGGKSMKPERAALFFAGVAVPKGYVVEHTCWNDACFASGHLKAVPANWREKPKKTIPQEIVEAAAEIVSHQFGVSRPDLNATGKRGSASRQIAFPRQVFRYLLNVELEYTLAMVAVATGCDVATVRHGNHLIEDRRDDQAFDDLMEGMAQRVRDLLSRGVQRAFLG
ncbi:hypothetical protein [Phyllobacterium leguminum]|uniref:DnaA-like protein n=1 Tax=Phyllobacterium leguminum TaxID=314237 RepID=A0A318T8I2_9HYPH|nr:hypothetical protein [Phyllobacterium leguminum]PYE86925.1 DnaA-like protein [Phyllobacterium leguminum]